MKLVARANELNFIFFETSPIGVLVRDPVTDRSAWNEVHHWVAWVSFFFFLSIFVFLYFSSLFLPPSFTCSWVKDTFVSEPDGSAAPLAFSLSYVCSLS